MSILTRPGLHEVGGRLGGGSTQVTGVGTVLAERRDRRTSVKAGSLYDYLGQAMRPRSDAELEYDVLPDDRACEVDRRVGARRAALEILDRAPSGVWALLHADEAFDSERHSPIDAGPVGREVGEEDLSLPGERRG